MKASEIIVFIAAVSQLIEIFLFILLIHAIIKTEEQNAAKPTPKKKPYETPFIEFTDEDTAFLLEYTRRTQTIPKNDQIT